jgi:hypothetical protein
MGHPQKSQYDLGNAENSIFFYLKTKRIARYLTSF